mmetsp:Transcript_133611/g.249891  ORF Transcript_133611/g.249891 Transcript_133611/m.249891 type:complete len:272 (-) Transcript_133611:149-964(-)
MNTLTRAFAWGTSRQARHSPKPRPRIRSSCSSTSVQTATRSDRFNTSIGMASSCHKHHVWSAASATHLSLWSPSRRWTTCVHGARNGTRRVFQRGPCRSTCTTCLWQAAAVVSVERSQLAGSWTSRAANVWRKSVSSVACGLRTVMRSNATVSGARATNGPSPLARGRKRRKMLRLTWSIHARTASDAGQSMQKSCLDIKVWPSAPYADGLAIRRYCPEGRSANLVAPKTVGKTKTVGRTRQKSNLTSPRRTPARQNREAKTCNSSLLCLR